LTQVKLSLTTQLWKYSGESAWHFVTLPADVSARIKFLQSGRRGFGAVRVKATIGKSQFETSVFPDSKSGCYLLPVKASIRKAEKIGHGDVVKVIIAMQSR
jgi:hypothetical protein